MLFQIGCAGEFLRQNRLRLSSDRRRHSRIIGLWRWLNHWRRVSGGQRLLRSEVGFDGPGCATVIGALAALAATAGPRP